MQLRHGSKKSRSWSGYKLMDLHIKFELYNRVLYHKLYIPHTPIHTYAYTQRVFA